MSSLSFSLCVLSMTIFAVPPSTKKSPVVDVYHGTKVTDDYRWLENWKATEVRQWSDAQNAYGRAVLDSLPNVGAIRKRVTEIMSAKSASYGGLTYRKGKYFAIKNAPPKQQPFLIVLTSLDAPDQGQVLVDPNTLDSHGTTSIDWFEPSPNGKLVAISLSKAGDNTHNI